MLSPFVVYRSPERFLSSVPYTLVCLQPYDSPYDDNGKLVQGLKFSKPSNRDINNPLYEATLGNKSGISKVPVKL